MTKPISPREAAKHKKTVFPREVIEAFNDLIAANLSNGRSTVMQKEVIALIIDKMKSDYPDTIRSKIFANGWLNVEEMYRAEGWIVTYDRPGYNETYEASFEFKKK